MAYLKYGDLLVGLNNYVITYNLCPSCVFFFPDLYRERVDLFGPRSAPELLFQIALACIGTFVVATFSYSFGNYFNVLRPIP